MATISVLDIISATLLEIGVLGVGEVPDAQQAATALAAYNRLIDQWKAERLMISTVTRATATITASKTSYTVGTGGDVNIIRPVFLDRVTYQDSAVSPLTEIPLGQLLTDEAYQQIPQKAQTGPRPISAYYNPTFPLGTLIPWPIPTLTTLSWVVYYGAPVDEYVNLTDTISVPPGYRRLFVKALGIELLPSYQRDANPLLMSQAADAKAVVKRSNERDREMLFPAESLIQGGMGRRNIWWSGQ